MFVHKGSLLHQRHLACCLKNIHYYSRFSSSVKFPICSPVHALRLLSPLALGGRSTFTTKRVRQGRWGGREGQEMNRWAKLVPLARTSLRPSARAFLFIHRKHLLRWKLGKYFNSDKVSNTKRCNDPSQLLKLVEGAAGMAKESTWITPVHTSRHKLHTSSLKVYLRWRELSVLQLSLNGSSLQRRVELTEPFTHTAFLPWF